MIILFIVNFEIYIVIVILNVTFIHKFTNVSSPFKKLITSESKQS